MRTSILKTLLIVTLIVALVIACSVVVYAADTEVQVSDQAVQYQPVSTDDAVDEIIGYALALLIAILNILSGFAIQAIREWMVKLKDSRSQDLAMLAIYTLDNLVDRTVKALQQTDVGAIKAAFTGKDREAKLDSLKRQAILNVKLNLVPEYLDVIKKSVHDIDDYIGELIEAKIFELKAGAASMPLLELTS